MSEFLGDSHCSESLHKCEASELQEPIQRHLVSDLSANHVVNALTEDLIDWLNTVDSENCDLATLDVILDELDKEAPLNISVDEETSLEGVHQKYESLFDAQCKEPTEMQQPRYNAHPAHTRLFRRISLIAAVVAVLLASMITAQAMGLDVFGFFANWTNEIFYFSEGKNATKETLGYPLAEGESAEYDSIEDALSGFHIDTLLVPNWYPSEIGNLDVTGCVTDQGMQIYAVSESETPFFMISISDFDETTGPAFVIEKDDANVHMHESGGYSHYIMNDGEWCIATWIVENKQCIISSTVTTEEIIKIIDSIYEVA